MMIESAQPLDNLEVLFFALDHPSAPTQLAWLCRLAGQLTLTQLRTHVASRLDGMPRSRERLHKATPPIGRYWEKDPEFSLARHLRRVRTATATLEDTLHVCCRLLSTPWDPKHPFWKIFLLQPPRGPSSILLRIHRGILPFENEGEFLNAMLDPQPTIGRRPLLARRQPAGESSPEASRRTTSGTSARAVLARLLRDPYLAFENLRRYTDSCVAALRAVVTPPPGLAALNGPLSHEFQLSAVRFSLNEVRQIRNRLGGNAFEILLSTITGGLSRALGRQVDLSQASDLWTCVPLTTGSEQDARRLGTRVTFAIARLPLAIADPVERLRRVSAELDLLRATQVPERYLRAITVTRAIPPPVFHALVGLLPRTAPVHTVCLELPSVRERRYVAGQEVVQIVPIAPLLLDVRVAFAIQTYADTVCVGATVDPRSKLTGDTLAQDIRRDFQQLLVSAGLSANPGD